MTGIPLPSLATSGLMGFLHRFHPAQLIKWMVYVLLLVNFCYYAWDEWEMAQHSLRQGGSLHDWVVAFATTIDEIAWFGLLFLWELETYWLPYDWNKPWAKRAMMVLRLVCYFFIFNTVVSRVIDFNSIADVQPLADISSPCQLPEQEWSYTYNLDYTLIDRSNCASFSGDNQFFAVESTAITDSAGLKHERFSRYIDLQDAITWLLVMFSIEIAIWLQARDITGGPLMLASYAAKIFYGLLLFHAATWVWNGHWVYGWDQVLWILGFFAIEMNVRDWREELQEEDEEASIASHTFSEESS